VEVALKRLKRGLMSGSERTSLRAYRGLNGFGAQAVPLVERELGRIDLGKPQRREVYLVVAGLASLLHDIDEARSDDFIERALRSGCSPAVGSILRAVRSYSSANYRRSTFAKITIWEQSSIDERYEASRHVKEWLSELPTDDLEGVSRIYIVTKQRDNDFAGTYLPGLAVITLVWDAIVPPGNLFNRLLNRFHRHTLVHEVGHHVHKHWFGQDPEQEAEAEAYVRAAAARRVPIWLRVARRLIKIAANILQRSAPSSRGLMTK
jgi:hypothetical protein